MTASGVFSFIANLAEISTGVVAGVAGIRVLANAAERRRRLESHLRHERAKDATMGREGMRTCLHLMGHLAMTEAQVQAAAFSSKHIKSWVAVDKDTGRADCLMFRYEPAPRSRKYAT
jgi:hypothetical protein